MQRLMVLGAGIGQLPIIKTARRRDDIYCIVVDKDPNAVGIKYANAHIATSVKDTGAIMGLARTMNIDGIIAPCADVGLDSYGMVVSELNLKGIGHQAITMCNDKAIFYRIMRKYGIKVPTLYDSLHEEFFPVVVKPSDGVSSKGVYRIDSFYQKPHPNELLEDAKTYSSDNTVIIQKFHPEVVFNCDLVIQDGKIKYYLLHDEHIFSGKKNFGADYFLHPSVYESKGFENSIIETCMNIIDVLEITDGNIAVEGIVHGNDVIILEVNPRLSGTFHIETHRDASLIDWGNDAIDVALGNPVRRKLSNPTPHGWVLIGAEEDGYIEDIYINYDIFDTDDYVLSWTLKEKGDFVKSYKCQETSTENAVCCFYIKDQCVDTVIDKLDQIKHHVKVITRR